MQRRLLISIGLLILSCSSFSQAQPAPAVVITPDQSRYFLLQPFFAAAPTSKPLLHHIGLDLVYQENTFVVTAVLDGYPAHLAGLRRGDKLLTVNGAAFHPVISFNSAVNIPAGVASQRPYSLELERNGERIVFDVIPVLESPYDSRRSASLSSIQEFSAGNKTIAYFHLWSLSRNLNDLLSFIHIIDSLAQSDGLILDLRSSYGFLSIQHLDAFLPSRRTLLQFAGDASTHTTFNRDAPTLLQSYFGKPVAILIDGNTAGGAELLAYQLAKLDRVTTIGESTAGELGTYQMKGDADDTSLTYLPPLHTSVDGIPLTEFRVQPKLEISYPLASATRSDPQFEAAFNLLLGRI